MKPAPRAVVLLLLIAVLAVMAGCTEEASPAQTPVPATTPPTPVPLPVYTQAPPYTELSEITLAATEMPFTVTREDHGVTVLPTYDPTGITRGATRGYQAYYADNQNDLPFTTAMRQQILEFSAGNAPAAYKQQIQMMKGTAGQNYRIVPYPDLLIGDESYGFVGVNKSGTGSENPSALVIFRKGDVVETITLKSPSGDIVPLATLTRKAASMIPGKQEGEPTPRRTIDPSHQPGIDLIYPLRATATSAETIGKLTLTVKLHDGSKPVDLTRMTYHLSEGNAGKSTGFSKMNDNGVQVTRQNAAGGKENLLEPGETVTIDLDLNALDIAGSPESFNKGFFVYVSDVNTPTLSFMWCRDIPAVMTPGAEYFCWK